MSNPIPTTANLQGYWQQGVGYFQDAAGTVPATANGDPVGCWKDQSGNGWHLTQSTNANRPTLAVSDFNGATGIRFTAANQTWLENLSFSGLNSSPGATVLLASRSPAFATAVGFAAGPQLEGPAPSDYWSQIGNYSYGHDANDPVIVPAVRALRYDGTQSTEALKNRVWLSGTSRTVTYPGDPAPATLAAASGVRVGRQWANANQWFDGVIYEIPVFSRALTDPEMASISTYYQGGLFGSLPSSIIPNGDSLTVSYPHNLTPWSIKLASLLGSGWICPNPNTLGCAETGATTTRIQTLSSAVVLLNRQFYRPKDYVCLWGGVNDLQAGVAPATVLANLISIATAQKNLGYAVAITTVTDRSDSPPTTFAADRTTLNNSIVAQVSPPWDFVIDLRGTTLDNAGARNDATLSNQDGVHLSQAGYDLYAQYVHDQFVASGVLSSLVAFRRGLYDRAGSRGIQ